ncbi:hypothetical protein HDU77_002227 [Chytriomyces hyalinus]|nr:hypothetical protein HDU77_002227 [Chytriomyces hyalinus]
MITLCILVAVAAHALAQDVRNCAKTADFFAFNPPALQYPAGVAAANFTVRLTSKPVGEVSQALNIDGFTMHPNVLKYTTDNWNVPQTVTLVAKPNVFSTGSAAALKLRYGVNAPCTPTVHSCESTYDIKYEASAPKTCISIGDPHLRLFDGSKCEGQEDGAFYLVKNQHMEVQAHHYKCGRFRCNGAASIRYGDSVVIVSAMKKYGSDGVGKTVEYTRLSQETTGISVNSKTKDQWIFTTDDGTVITIATHMFTEMSITINMSPYMASIKENSGVCAKGCKSWSAQKIANNDNHMLGKYVKGALFPPLAALWGKEYKNLVPGLKFTEADFKNVCTAIPPTTTTTTTSTTSTSTTSSTTSTSTTSTSTTSTSTSSTSTTTSTTSTTTSTTSTTTSTTSTSTTSSTTSTSTTSSTTTSSSASVSSADPAPTVPLTTSTTAASPSPSVYVPIYDPINYNYTVPAVNNTIPGTPIYSDADKVKATLQCREILNVPGCDELIADHIEFLISACVDDYLLTGTHVFSDAYLAALNAQCHHQCQTIIAAPIQVSNNTNVAANVQIVAGYNNNTCVNSCSGKGQCAALGCVCDAPWSGIDCSINLSQYSPPQPPVMKCENGTTYQGNYVAPVALNPAAAAVIAQYQPVAPAGSNGGVYTVGPLKTSARAPAATAGVMVSGAVSKMVSSAVVGLVTVSVVFMC